MSARGDAYRKLARARELESEAWLALALAEDEAPAAAPVRRDALLSYEDVARQWGVDSSHVARLAARGVLKVTRISERCPRISQSEADRYRGRRTGFEGTPERRLREVAR